MKKKYEKCLTPKTGDFNGMKYPIDCSECRVCKEHIAKIKEHIATQTRLDSLEQNAFVRSEENN